MSRISRILHVGCGRKKWSLPVLMEYVGLNADISGGAELLHLDADEQLHPDLVCRLGEHPIPLPDDSVDLIIAWHVLEHIGKQGESAAWFSAWEEMYRVLKSDGWIYAECPYYSSIWAWSDPTHARAMSEHSLIFFSQDAYRAPGSMISPYRINCDFVWLGIPGMDKGWALVKDSVDPKAQSIRFAMMARKPLKPWWED